MFKKIMALALVASAALASGWWTDGISSYPSPYKFTVAIKPFLYDGVAPVPEGEGAGEYTIKTVLHYLMNDSAASVDVIDSSANAYTGFAGANTDTLSSDGRINSALTFNGTTDIVYSPAITNAITDKMSICFWLKTTSSSYGRVVAGIWGALFIDLQSSGVARASINNGEWNDLYGSISVNDGNWHLLVLVYDGAEARLYIDGVLDGSLNLTGNVITLSGGLKIGADGPYSLPFEGRVDDVRLYDAPIYLDEIAEIFNSGVGTESELTTPHQPPPPPPPVVVTFDVQGLGTADFYENTYTVGQYFNESPYLPTFYPTNPSLYWDGSWYDFLGSYYYTYSQVPASDVTLMPTFLSRTTLTFNYQGGTDNAGVPTTYVYSGFPLSQWGWPYTDPTRDGYFFSGWNTSSDGSGTYFSQNDSYYNWGDPTLFAVWSANGYTVYFDPNGGDTLDPASTWVFYDSAYGTLPTPTQTGFIFNGWFTEATGGAQVFDTDLYQTLGDQTLYAQWTAE